LTKLPLIDAERMEKLLFLLGFSKVRQKGSHAFYRHPDGRTTTIPHHHGRILARPLLTEILREVQLSVDQYNNYLKQLSNLPSKNIKNSFTSISRIYVG